MQSLHIIRTTAHQWGLPHGLPCVLHAAGAVGASEQAAGLGNAGSDFSVPGRTWPGADIGIRRPSVDETPLSLEEVRVAMREGLLL